MCPHLQANCWWSVLSWHREFLACSHFHNGKSSVLGCMNFSRITERKCLLLWGKSSSHRCTLVVWTQDLQNQVVDICVGAWWLSLDWVLRWLWGVAVACNPATKHWTNFFLGWNDLLPKQKFPGLQEATCGLVGHYWPDPLLNKHSVVVNFNVCGMWCPSIMYVELRGTNFLPTNLLADKGYRAESWWLLHC